MIEPGGVATIRSRSAWAPLLVWMGIVAIALGLVGLIVSAPLARSANHQGFAFTIYRAFSYACHQLPERSFYLSGYQLAVCARCTGLYLGFGAAALIYPLVRPLSRTDTPARRWLLLAALPLAIDVGLDLIGLWKNTHLSRLFTGLLLGSVAAFYVIPGLIDLLRVVRNNPRADVVWPAELR
ncbi:MAG: DUF2085 domain-containing protein [Pyrinomonadaceae bacterium]